MKTLNTVKSIIEKWYLTLFTDRKYDAEFYRALDEIYIDEKASLEEYDVTCQDGKKNLLSFLYFIEQMEKTYEKMGASREIFLDSARDIVRWCDAWSDKMGEVYLGELKWLKRGFLGNTVTLGRLQFCFEKAGHTIEKYDVQQGDTVVAIHIPASGPLLLDDAKKSVVLAKDFFKKTFPDTPFKAFTCHSWLLDPTHSEIMKEGSNILAFQTMFDIVGINESDSIFGYVFKWRTKREELEFVNPTTSFAKTVKEKALAGRKFYEGLGVLII